MKQRKPHPHSEPFKVTPEKEREWREMLENEQASAALALENFYKQDEWWFHSEEARRTRERLDAAQGITRP